MYKIFPSVYIWLASFVKVCSAVLEKKPKMWKVHLRCTKKIMFVNYYAPYGKKSPKNLILA